MLYRMFMFCPNFNTNKTCFFYFRKIFRSNILSNTPYTKPFVHFYFPSTNDSSLMSSNLCPFVSGAKMIVIINPENPINAKNPRAALLPQAATKFGNTNTPKIDPILLIDVANPDAPARIFVGNNSVGYTKFKIPPPMLENNTAILNKITKKVKVGLELIVKITNAVVKPAKYVINNGRLPQFSTKFIPMNAPTKPIILTIDEAIYVACCEPSVNADKIVGVYIEIP